MNKLTQALMEELTVEYVKVGPLQIPESVVISWVIMVLVVLGSILLTRNLKVDHISKRQAVLEMAYTAGKNFFEGLLGKEGACYVPYLMTVAIYIACSNLIGVFGVKPPTKDLDVTAALALMSIVLIEYSGIHARGGLERKLGRHLQECLDPALARLDGGKGGLGHLGSGKVAGGNARGDLGCGKGIEA